MIGLSFSPLHAARLSLIANTAPVAFGAIRTPIITLAAITDISHLRLSAMAGRQLAFVPILIPMWLVMTYSGTDATLGLAFTRTGFLYPFFAAMLGWLGVALTGSDTSSNVLFGSLQKITAQQLGLNPVLITAANSTGGVMGKMIDAQSIVVATASTGQHGQEGKILRFVFWHSIVLAAIMGVIVMLQAYVSPWMIP
jgi:lactate permease